MIAWNIIVILNHIITYHIISYHIKTNHIVSYTLYNTISYHITLNRIISHIISYHIIISYHHITSYHIISYHIDDNDRITAQHNTTQHNTTQHNLAKHLNISKKTNLRIKRCGFFHFYSELSLGVPYQSVNVHRKISERVGLRPGPATSHDNSV